MDCKGGIVAAVMAMDALEKCGFTSRPVHLLLQSDEENGLPVLTGRACLSGSDAAYVTQYGIPCVDNLGTEGGNIHSLKEYIRLDSLVEAAIRIGDLIYCI